MKKCSNCSEIKSLDSFYRLSRSPDGRAYWCKKCNSQYHNKWDKERSKRDPEFRKEKSKAVSRSIKRNPEKARNRQLLRVYGISLDQFKQLLILQNNRCKICGTEASEDRSLSVDHCHKVGTIRGLLCQSCNTLLGQAKDDINILSKAIQYLEASRGESN